eukprot:SAG31_NODE_34086_length_336_cov_1.291139_2_plen_39_part_01
MYEDLDDYVWPSQAATRSVAGAADPDADPDDASADSPAV